MAQASSRQHEELSTVRDTVESVYIAVVVALVLRAFLVEAFVIPTGSMAPRLMGEHWDLRCPSCGYEYSYGTETLGGGETFNRGMKYSVPRGAHCPNCGYEYAETHLEEYVNSGDRVLVLKYLYRFRQPEPWEVVVFRNPQDDRINYIKRLIGLPGEKIEIIHGDVFFAKADTGGSGYGPWQIRRKDPQAQAAMWQIIFNNDYRPDPKKLTDQTYPKWEDPDSLWNLSEVGGRRFVFPGSQGASELRLDASRDKFLPNYGYNPPISAASGVDTDRDICSDLRLEATFLPEAQDSKVTLQTTALEHMFRAEFSGEGTVRLLHRQMGDDGDAWKNWGEGKKVEGLVVGRGCDVALAHADFRVQVWVDGRLALQTDDQQYPADHEAILARMKAAVKQPLPTPEVRIIAQGGPCRLEHVKLMRDVYYTSPPLNTSPSAGPAGDFFRQLKPSQVPKMGWGTTGNPIELRKYPGTQNDLDEFFVLGDNSPRSLDGRLWVDAAPTLRLYDEQGDRLYKLGTVPRYSLIGRAFFVYWPSGFRIPGLARLPLIPNVGRMRVIR